MRRLILILLAFIAGCSSGMIRSPGDELTPEQRRRYPEFTVQAINMVLTADDPRWKPWRRMFDTDEFGPVYFAITAGGQACRLPQMVWALVKTGSRLQCDWRSPRHA